MNQSAFDAKIQELQVCLTLVQGVLEKAQVEDTRLRADNERLREALRQIALLTDVTVNEGPWMASQALSE